MRCRSWLSFVSASGHRPPEVTGRPTGSAYARPSGRYFQGAWGSRTCRKYRVGCLSPALIELTNLSTRLTWFWARLPNSAVAPRGAEVAVPGFSPKVAGSTGTSTGEAMFSYSLAVSLTTVPNPEDVPVCPHLSGGQSWVTVSKTFRS